MMHHPKVIRKSVLGSSFHAYMYVFRVFIAMSVVPPRKKAVHHSDYFCPQVTLHHRHFSAAFPKVFRNVLGKGWFISWKIVFNMDNLGLHTFQETSIWETGAKMVQENHSNMFKPFQSHSFELSLNDFSSSGNLWSNVKHDSLWEISSLNLCILFNPEFWSSTILQTRTQCPRLIQHNSITDKVSHTFPVSSVCSKASPIPPLARRVCRGIGTHHHCLLAYGKKGRHAGQTNRLQNFLTLLIFNDQTQHCGSSSSLFYFPTMRIHQIWLFFLLLLVKIRYFRNIWLVSSPHCVAVSPNHCWICKCPHHFVGWCINVFLLSPGLTENPEHTSIIIRLDMIIPSTL